MKLGRWDKPDLPPFGDPWSSRWANWGRGLDQTLKEIKEIDKNSDYHRLRYILKHDDNRGYGDLEDLR